MNKEIKERVTNRLLGVLDDTDSIIKVFDFTQKDSYDEIYEALDCKFDNEWLSDEARFIMEGGVCGEEWAFDKANENRNNEQNRVAEEVYKRLKK